MKRETAKLLKHAHLVFGALALHSELGSPGNVNVSSTDIMVSGLSVAALKAWINHLTEIRYYSQGDSHTQFAAVEGKFHDIEIRLSAPFRHPEAVSLLANEPMSAELLERLAVLPQSGSES